MNTAVKKVCTQCGIDVSQQKRIKDQKGQYYCHPCWNSRLASSTTEFKTASTSLPNTQSFMPPPDRLPRTTITDDQEVTTQSKGIHQASDSNSSGEDTSSADNASTTRRTRWIKAAAIAVTVIVIFGIAAAYETHRIHQAVQDQSDVLMRTADVLQKQAAKNDPPKESKDVFGHTASAKKALTSYVKSAQSFVSEIKGLQARLDAGMNYGEFRDKIQSTNDAYAQIEGDPGDDTEAKMFVSNAGDAMKHYGEALSIWRSIVNQSLGYRADDRDKALKNASLSATMALNGFKGMKIMAEAGN